VDFKFSAAVRVNWDTAGLTLKAPVATYRVQLNRSFGFSELKEVVPYLAKLGVSHIYASPIFKARSGSTHGYDIIDHTAVSEELGGRVAFEELNREASSYGLKWIQDIVPNHAAYSLENQKVVDILQNGSASRYSSFFDINWSYPSPNLKGRVLVPFLAQEPAKDVKQGEILLTFNDESGFKISYKGLEFPVNDKSTRKLLKEKNVTKTIKQYNSSLTLLASLLSSQFYCLSYWRDAFKEINYRRFFDILDLIGVQVEEPTVFEETHRLIFDLMRNGEVAGLRVDHIDGLYDPQHYLQTLHKRVPDAYLIVEKILTDNENMPDSWPIQGSTGYDFVNHVNGVFIKQANEAAIDKLYKRFTLNTQAFSELLFDCKETVIENYFLGDIGNLARRLSSAAENFGQNKVDHAKMQEAVAMLVACFQVYRTYLNLNSPTEETVYFSLALNQAKQRKPKLSKEFDIIEFLFRQCSVNTEALEALMRFQQFTGAVMAKGLEDTAFYRYCRFLSLNEVGGCSAKFGFSADEFHLFNLSRQTRWPLTLNASSTHDTKRGEDARARLNVLSEIPRMFEEHLYRWAEVNNKHKAAVNGELAPDHNEEYLIYQTLLGSYPFDEEEKREFTRRVTAFMIKALREAKTHTSWLNSNKEYENTAEQFTSQTLADKNFLEDFLPFQKQVAQYGFFNTLSQTLLKITCPGVPDFYQGSELWNLSMVDPDNRRPVDYQKRNQFLTEISEIKASNARKLIEDYSSGKAKLYVIFKALQVRRQFKALFEEGAYVPLTVEGKQREHVFAFMRKRQDTLAVVIVSRFMTNLLEPQCITINWEDTAVKLPVNTPATWKEIFTDSNIHAVSGSLPLGEVLDRFPVALLVGGINV
jgi:(1->4)-alpha-D-glucan 1-alpha-D-glucosylmutase